MIVYTCPKCGEDLFFSIVCTYPPINVTECPKCGWRSEQVEKIQRMPFMIEDMAAINTICKEKEE